MSELWSDVAPKLVRSGRSWGKFVLFRFLAKRLKNTFMDRQIESTQCTEMAYLVSQ